ncbi:Fe-S cluster assembly sulfur transfer protein SufU [uncultured Bifidobacterium sp.]|uniref:Fe-S cluster assembly sulfur transfer protein SufU n=1 Tax=uncultured Bifidobacterium sp. TaxID=165187 RepID=UPI00261E0DBB|nr:SUF system NifU family Fe-S cluster assembly protein [uncultured Bifidobacterium sp.]
MNDFDMDDEDLQQMYQEVILDASKDPHGRVRFADDLTTEDSSATLGTATMAMTHDYCTAGESHQFNPTCGDEATIRVEVSRDVPRRIDKIIWDGQGCSISQASLSVMTDLVEGSTVDEAMRLEGLFHDLMNSRGAGLDDEAQNEALGDAVVFQGVSRYPMRIKCALLAWEGMKDSVARAVAAQTPPAQESVTDTTADDSKD